MTKFKLAQSRNYFKYVIAGLLKPVNLQSLSQFELLQWENILASRKLILENFNQTSINMGLNVIEPCECGKRRKIKCEEEYCNK